MTQIKDQMPVTEPGPMAVVVVEAVVPTACLSQALGTRASTTFDFSPQPSTPLLCVNLRHLRIQKTCLTSYGFHN